MRRGTAREYLKGTRRHGNVRLPIRKFLFSRVGQQWDKVHKELSEEFDRRTYAGYRFWRSFGHWGKDVDDNCWIGAETGTIYSSGTGWGGIDIPVEGFYVHPFTGILCYKREEFYKKKEEKEVTEIKLDEFNAYKKIEGIWYRVKYTLNPYYCYTSSYLSSSLFHSDDKYSIHTKRQLNHKELHAMNLVNDPADKWQDKVCEVCYYIDGDKHTKRCFYCETCKAWICDKDKDNWYRRTTAAGMKLKEKLLKQQEQQ